MGKNDNKTWKIDVLNRDLRKIQLIFFSNVIFGLIFVIFGTINLFLKNYFTMYLDFIAMGIGILNLVYFLIKKNISFASNIIIVIGLFVSAILFWNGGFGNTGFIWMFVMPHLVFFLKGKKIGLFLCSLLFITNASIYFLSRLNIFPVHYDLKFIFVMFFVYFLNISAIIFYEHLRDRYERLIMDNSKKLIKLNEDLKHFASYDFLTEIFNRREIIEVLRSEISRKNRYGITSSILLIDIDNFKKVNDTYGHLFGDAVLKEISSIISSSIRNVDCVGRFGGEEFLVILPSTTESSALLLSERIRKNVKNGKFTTVKGERVSITISLGATEIKESEDDQALLSRVDEALYKAKDMGKDQVIVY